MRLLALILAGVILLPLLVGAIATFVIARQVEARFPPAGRFVPVAGGRIHLLDTGPPPGGGEGTVVLIHGASGNLHDMMLSLGDRLRERYRVVAVDRPGHGWSDRIDGARAALPARQAALIAEALRGVGVSRAVVVGHSWGGALVPNLALDHADVTGAVVMLAPVTHTWPGGRISWYYQLTGSMLGWLATRTITTPIGWWVMEDALPAVFAPQPPAPNYLEAARIPLLLRPKVFHANAQDVAGLYEAVGAQSPRYPEIRVPVAVISGDRDRIVHTPLHSEPFAKAVPGARLTVLPGVGHMVPYAAPDVVIGEIDRLAGEARAAGARAGEPAPVR